MISKSVKDETARRGPLAVAQPVILVVDDDASIQKLVLQRITRLRAISATTGEETMERASAVRPDLVLLDIALPDASG